MYKVIASRNGFIAGVHHNIRAASAAEAISIARMFYPPKTRISFRAEEV